MTPCDSYHDVVVHVPHVVHVHGDLGGAAVAPRRAGGRDRALARLAARGKLEVGAVWLPVETRHHGYKGSDRLPKRYT